MHMNKIAFFTNEPKKSFRLLTPKTRPGVTILIYKIKWTKSLSQQQETYYDDLCSISERFLRYLSPFCIPFMEVYEGLILSSKATNYFIALP